MYALGRYEDPPLHLSPSNTSFYVELVGINWAFFPPEPARWIPLGMSNNVLRHKKILALLLRYENRFLDAYGRTDKLPLEFLNI
jgi:hypothetical protein